MLPSLGLFQPSERRLSLSEPVRFTDRKARLAEVFFATRHGHHRGNGLGVKKAGHQFPRETFYKPVNVFIQNDPWALPFYQ